ncbi:FAD-dependent thymidylate synthase [Agrobacterium vitis]|uniref:FAD-dependent thymidylate synthase n=1 Tax=Agrobacterium vitis TaxID=373 RepID=UPI0012E88D29|nr:FAD-dependent thymidylate synthase [Agrobacterium vitis]MVA33956.1 FAD-dependent thymidylate synthase [Agrobacterium vitis]
MTNLTIEQIAEIELLRSKSSATLRSISPGLEDILHKAFPVLDHGIIRVVDYMGDDSAIVQAARVSYGRGTRRVQEDSGLINYLLRHYHTTPFEMAEIKFHVKLPIFVARQWIRHRTASVNEYSARYSVLDNEFYIPEPEHLAAQSTSNRQGRGTVLEGDEAAEVLLLLRRDAEQAYSDYSTMLNDPSNPDHRDDRSGLARELARMNLSLNFYTQWYWKTDLHNLMNFLRLRADSHAQYEIRAYADVMLEIMAAWVPIAHAAFKEHRMEAIQLSGTAVKAVRRMIAGEAVTRANSGLSIREWQELTAAFDVASTDPT